MRTEVPFGPFLALAAAFYALFQPQLLHWYLSR
jgi:prepilin signal peptidase PulO-like enzyme (type II secretory pathway)